LKTTKASILAATEISLVGLVVGWALVAFVAGDAAEEPAVGGHAEQAVPDVQAEGPASGDYTEAPPATVPEPADNSYCYVCHLNYEEEQITIAHQRAGIGCETCHGPSDAHSSDEDSLTPPDIMFSKTAINAACGKCHMKLADIEGHQTLVAGASKQKYCTDCHGKHRIEVRTRIWDKKSGELISDDGVRMMYERSP